MNQELPLYIFFRNTLFLGLLFVVISVVIIEKGRLERGDNSIFNRFPIKQKDIRDYNNFDITKSQGVDSIHEYSNHFLIKDSIANNSYKLTFSAYMVENGSQPVKTKNKISL